MSGDAAAARAYITEGMKLLSQRRHGEAQTRFKMAIAADPTGVDGYSVMGGALAADARYDDALEYVDKATKLLTGNESAEQYMSIQTNRAGILYMTGRLEEAVRCLDSAWDWLEKTAPGNRNMRNLLAMSFKSLGEIDRAESCSNGRSGGRGGRRPKKTTTGPDAALEHYSEGSMLLAVRDDARAAACFERAIKVDPSLAAAHHSLGTAKRRMGMYGDAFACFERAIKADPSFAIAYSDMAKELDRMGRRREALECVDRALSLEPNLNFAVFAKGMILFNLDRYEEALSHFDRALAGDSRVANIHTYKGMALIMLSRYAQAVECLERALELDPDDSEALSLLESARQGARLQR